MDTEEIHQACIMVQHFIFMKAAIDDAYVFDKIKQGSVIAELIQSNNCKDLFVNEDWLRILRDLKGKSEDYFKDPLGQKGEEKSKEINDYLDFLKRFFKF